MVFALPPEVTHEQAEAVTVQALRALSADSPVVDAGALTRFDSSVIAVLLAVDRHVRDQGGRLRVTHAPQRLRSLLQVYALDAVVPLTTD